MLRISLHRLYQLLIVIFTGIYSIIGVFLQLSTPLVEKIY